MIRKMFRSIPQSPLHLPDNSHNRPKKKRLLQKEKGFTLIEMIVVIVIMGILASIAIGILIHVRERACRTKTKRPHKPEFNPGSFGRDYT